MMEFTEEPIYVEEVKHLFKMHHEEVGSFQSLALDPDYDVLAFMQSQGMVRSFVIRVHNQIVGYSIFTITKDLLHKTKVTATEWLTYIHPDFRGRGYEFIKFVDSKLEADIIYRSVKVKKDHGAMLRRAGYEVIDHLYGKLKHG
jgi:hypothetical protein